MIQKNKIACNAMDNKLSASLRGLKNIHGGFVVWRDLLNARWSEFKYSKISHCSTGLSIESQAILTQQTVVCNVELNLLKYQNLAEKIKCVTCSLVVI